MKPESVGPSEDLFQWGHKQAAASKPQELENSMELKLSSMKSALMERRVIHADDFKYMFGWDARTCRAIAAASDGHIISTHDGYLLTERATPEEFDAANGRIYSQAKNMLRRAIRERRVRHEQIGQAQGQSVRERL
jgi:hypothetical protein